MKFNLKNKPKLKSVSGKYVKCSFKSLNCDEWFEGFEKELREITKKYRFSGEFYQGIVKEILGESPP